LAAVVVRDIFPSQKFPSPSLHVACIAKLAFTTPHTSSILVKRPTRKKEREREREREREGGRCGREYLNVIVIVPMQ